GDGAREPREEVGGQLGRALARKTAPGAVLDREPVAAGAAEQARHVRMPRERVVGTQLAAHEPAAERRAPPRRAAGEGLHHDRPALAQLEAHLRLASGPVLEDG